jgi:hypothetical protein
VDCKYPLGKVAASDGGIWSAEDTKNCS